jgi:hypothetical protein
MWPFIFPGWGNDASAPPARAYPTAVLVQAAPAPTRHGAPVVTVAPAPASARQSVLVTTRNA